MILAHIFCGTVESFTFYNSAILLPSPEYCSEPTQSKQKEISNFSEYLLCAFFFYAQDIVCNSGLFLGRNDFLSSKVIHISSSFILTTFVLNFLIFSSLKENWLLERSSADFSTKGHLLIALSKFLKNRCGDSFCVYCVSLATTFLIFFNVPYRKFLSGKLKEFVVFNKLFLYFYERMRMSSFFPGILRNRAHQTKKQFIFIHFH
uniref:7TM_GPCR_Srx domain-containing protein n=1 Tax=Heterorhabditis bacteriophora TaxID=37862 RepID=A0A1I7W9C8_HETBA